jgi:hypothetical protein
MEPAAVITNMALAAVTACMTPAAVLLGNACTRGLILRDGLQRDAHRMAAPHQTGIGGCSMTPSALKM